MQTGTEEFLSIQAVRPPTLIDDAFKKTAAMEYRKVVRNSNLTQLWEWLPFAYPLDSAFADRDSLSDKKFLGINKYPIEKWRTTDRPFMTSQSWMVFAMTVAAGHDEECMERLMKLGFAMFDPNPKQAQYNQDLGEKKLIKRAQDKLAQGQTYPRDLQEVLSTFTMKHGEANQKTFDAGFGDGQ